MLNLDSALGIEVRDGNVYLASISKGFWEHSLKANRIVVNFESLNPHQIAGEVQEFLEAAGISRENMILGIPRDEVVIRRLQLPLEVEDNLDQVVQFQVEKYEPREEEKSCYDYLVVDRDEERARILINVYMVRRSVLDKYLARLGEFGIRPVAATLNAIGVAQSLILHRDGYPKKEAVVLIRVNQDSTDLVLIDSGGHVHSHQLSVTGSDRVDAILDGLVSFGSEIGVSEVARIYVTGDNAASLQEVLKESSDEVELLSEGSTLKQKGLTKKALDELSGALGLAASGLNRLPASALNFIPKEERVVRERASMIPTYVIGAILLVLVIALLGRGYLQESELLAQVDRQIDSYQSEVDQALQLESRYLDRKQELEELREILSGRTRTVAILEDLTERLPMDTYLQNLQIDSEEARIQGYSDNANTLIDLVADSPCLENLKVNWIQNDPRNPGKERFNFTASVQDCQ